MLSHRSISTTEMRPTLLDSYQSDSFRELNEKYFKCMNLLSQKNEEITKLKLSVKQEQAKSQRVKEQLMKCRQLKDKYLKSRNEWKNIS